MIDEISLMRTKEMPSSDWSQELREFYSLWHQHKMEHCILDFIDLIGIFALEGYLDQKWIRGMSNPPTIESNPVGGVSHIFVDEFQDYSALELRVIEKWANSVGRVTYVGDVDQCIYGFRGSSPELFEKIISEADSIETLKQSHRVPVKVYDFARRVILRNEDRRDWEYHPTKEEGKIITTFATSEEPEPIIEYIGDNLSCGESTMILAPCLYTLKPLYGKLRKHNITYESMSMPDSSIHNPMSSDTKSSPIKRIKSFLYPYYNDGALWPISELNQFVSRIDSSNLAAKAKENCWHQNRSDSSDNPEDPFMPQSLEDYLWIWDTMEDVEKAYVAAADGDLNYFFDRILPSEIRKYDYYRDKFDEDGLNFLERKVLVSLGTIHSSKGMEADHVILFPDLSKAFDDQMREDGSEINRLFYVGSTRAKKTLMLCSPNRKRKFDFWRDFDD